MTDGPRPRPRFGEEWLVAVLDSLSEGVIAVDAEGRLTAANPAAEALLGFSVGTRRFEHWTALVPQDLRDRDGTVVDPHPITRALGGEPTPVRNYAVGEQGLWWELATHLLDPVAGRGSGVVVTFRDVTERVTAQQERELAAEVLREVLAMTTHDLRGPILTISGYAGLLAETPEVPDTQLQMFGDAIRRQTTYLSKLVSDLSLTARIEADAVAADPGQVAVAALVSEALSGIELDAVRVDVADDLSVAVDPDHGHRILANLLENAHKYGAAPVTVTARPVAGDAVEIVVADGGPGVPEELVPRLFDRYSRSAPPGVEGTGLGLAIVAKLARLNGGSVRYDGGDHAGARFVVRLPAWGSASEGEPRARVAAPSDGGPHP